MQRSSLSTQAIPGLMTLIGNSLRFLMNALGERWMLWDVFTSLRLGSALLSYTIVIFERLKLNDDECRLT